MGRAGVDAKKATPKKYTKLSPPVLEIVGEMVGMITFDAKKQVVVRYGGVRSVLHNAQTCISKISTESCFCLHAPDPAMT